jgi:hypothetical protein
MSISLKTVKFPYIGVCLHLLDISTRLLATNKLAPGLYRLRMIAGMAKMRKGLDSPVGSKWGLENVQDGLEEVMMAFCRAVAEQCVTLDTQDGQEFINVFATLGILHRVDGESHRCPS